MTKDFVYICDDNYCLPTAVSINSLIENLKQTNSQYNIFVCSFGLSGSNISMLESLTTSHVHVVVKIFDPGLYSSKLDSISQKTHVTPTALIKFELANLFPAINSICYLDSDIIIKGDIEELLATSVNDYYLAACQEFMSYLNDVQYHFRTRTDFYFNSGVMLLNLGKIREEKLTEQLWDYKINRAKTKLMDQETLNKVFEKKVKPLSIKWNFNPVFCYLEYLNAINRNYGCNYQSIKELEKDVKIVHYVGKFDKPWVYKTARFKEYWDMYFERFSDSIKLNYEISAIQNRSFSEKLVGKIKNVGLIGVISYLFFKLTGSRY